MQKELQITLTIIGILVIGGVLLHGIWTSRKNAQKVKKARFEPAAWDTQIDADAEDDMGDPGLDDLGVDTSQTIPNNKTNARKQWQSSRSENDMLGDSDTDTGGVGFENFSNYAKYVKDENSVANVSSQFDDAEQLQSNKPVSDVLKSNTIASKDGRSRLDNEHSVASSQLTQDPHRNFDKDEPDTTVYPKQGHSPLYSNVVTQPKPDFGKNNTDSKDSGYGQPPEFLLKNQQAKRAEQSQSLPASALHEPKFTPSNPEHNPQAVSSNSDRILPGDNSLREDGNLREKNSPHQDSNRRTRQLFDDAPEFTLDGQDDIDNSNNPEQNITQKSNKSFSFAEQAKRFVRRNKKTVAQSIRPEHDKASRAFDDQMRMEFNEPADVDNDTFNTKSSDTPQHQHSDLAASAHHDNSGLKHQAHGTNAEASQGNSRQNSSQQNSIQNGITDVLVLNLRANDDNQINGASLLPLLLTLGFKFGEHDIFHRHVNSNGKGPVLFSLTNMFKPGVFDIDNIENFNTYGLSLFMMLPIDGDPQQVFNMMHNAARKLADEFSCKILDGNKATLSKQSLQQYSERIREFERRRLGKNS